MTGVLGIGWRHAYEMRVATWIEDVSGPHRIVVGPQGRRDFYTGTASSYVPPPGVTSVLTKLADSTYRLTSKDQTVYRFASCGRLDSITDRFGNVSNLVYDVNDRLSQVTDPAGRGVLSFNYDGNGGLISATDWSSPSRTVAFEYEPYTYDNHGQTVVTRLLNKVTDRTGAVWRYEYDYSPGKNQFKRLLRVKDANGIVQATYTYYEDSGLVASVTDAQNNVVSYSYQTAPDGSPQTRMTLPTTSFEPGFNPVMTHTYSTTVASAPAYLVRTDSLPTSNPAEAISTTMTYDANGFPRTGTDALGRTVTSCYDVGYSGSAVSGSRGNLTRVIAEQPYAGQPITTTNVRPILLYQYDGKDNLTQFVAPNGIQHPTVLTDTNTADCTTNMSTWVNTLYAQDYTWNITGTYLLSTTTRYQEVPGTGPTLAAVMTYTYDLPANPGKVKTVTNANNHKTTFTYTNGMRTQAADAYGKVVTMTYDLVGRLISARDVFNKETKTTYDAEDRVRFVIQPPPVSGQQALTTEHRYDPTGLRTSTIDPRGQVVRSTYDSRNQLKAVAENPNTWTDPATTPAGTITTTYSYDPLGNRIRALRATGTGDERAVDTAYDGLGRMRFDLQYPDWPDISASHRLTTTYQYDKNANVTAWTQPQDDGEASPRTTNYTYDSLDRIRSILYNDPAIAGTNAYSGTTNALFTFDRNGNRVQRCEESSGACKANTSESFTFDSRNLLTRQEQRFTAGRAIAAGIRATTYKYDRVGNHTQLSFAAAAGEIGTQVTVNYAYDLKERLVELVEGTRSTAFTYFNDDLPDTTNHFNGTTTSQKYDDLRRLAVVNNLRAQTCNGSGKSTIINVFTYTLDLVGNRTHQTAIQKPVDDDCGAPVQSDKDYSYDRLNRLTGVSGGGSPDVTSTSYDQAGNRLHQVRSNITTTYTYDKADRLTSYSVPGGGGSSLVTNRGNARRTPVDDLRVFVFDQANRILQTKQPSPAPEVVTGRYQYDLEGNRTERELCCQADGVSAHTSFRYTLDLAAGLPLVLDDGHTTFIWANGRLLYSIPRSGRWGTSTTNWNLSSWVNDGPFVAHPDGQGSVTAYTSKTKKLLWLQRTDAFGQEVTGGGDLPEDLQNLLPFAYTGQQQENESKLTFLRARYYDPVGGRFMSRDPFAGYAKSSQSQNRYAYAGNNPATFVDPSGRFQKPSPLQCLKAIVCELWGGGGRGGGTQAIPLLPLLPLPDVQETKPGDTGTDNPERKRKVYYRLKSETQTPEDARKQVESGQIWGRVARYGIVPQVKAYRGNLPPGAKGIEFETDVEPDSGSKPGDNNNVTWTAGRPGVAESPDKEFAIIDVTITRQNQYIP